MRAELDNCCVTVVMLSILLGGLPQPALAQSPASGQHLANPASRFDGIWQKSGFVFRYAEDPPLTPAARAKVAGLRPQDDPAIRCTEVGTPTFMIAGSVMNIIALPNQLLMVAESNHFVRRIYTNNQAHPADPDQTFYGDSVVTWDGDTMVVDTVGFNDRLWLDAFGDPVTPKMHMVERWHLKNDHTLQITFTFDDPAVYTKPWTTRPFTYHKFADDYHIYEDVCNENNRNNPDDPKNPKDFTSTDQPAGFTTVVTPNGQR